MDCNNYNYHHRSELQTQIDELKDHIDQLERQILSLQKADSDSTSTTTTTDETADWQTYTNDEYGFSFKYPSDWNLAENEGNNFDQSVVSISSVETQSAIEDQKIDGSNYGPYSDDLSVYYYPTVSEESENVANNLGATNINQLIEKNEMIELIGTTILGGMTATEVYWGGMGKYYSILLEKDSHLYKIWFSNIDDKDELTNTEKSILSTFEFTN